MTYFLLQIGDDTCIDRIESVLLEWMDTWIVYTSVFLVYIGTWLVRFVYMGSGVYRLQFGV